MLDPKEYIASGILELYVMQSLSPQEAAEVEAAALQHPEIAAELAAIRLALESYSHSLAVPPPAGAKAKLMQSIRTGTSAPPPQAKKTPLTPSRRYLRITAYAASVALLVSLLVNFVQYGNNRNLRNDLARQQEQIKGLNADYDKIYTAYYDLEEKMDRMAAPENRMVHLMGMKNNDVATVVWSPGKKEVYLSVNQLTAPPEGMQYQLWAIVDEKPVDLGVFDAGMKGYEMARMKDIDHATAFAVTLEKAGGSPIPTMDALWLMGKVEAS